MESQIFPIAHTKNIHVYKFNTYIHTYINFIYTYSFFLLLQLEGQHRFISMQLTNLAQYIFPYLSDNYTYLFFDVTRPQCYCLQLIEMHDMQKQHY